MSCVKSLQEFTTASQSNSRKSLVKIIQTNMQTIVWSADITKAGHIWTIIVLKVSLLWWDHKKKRMMYIFTLCIYNYISNSYLYFLLPSNCKDLNLDFEVKIIVGEFFYFKLVQWSSILGFLKTFHLPMELFLQSIYWYWKNLFGERKVFNSRAIFFSNKLPQELIFHC